MATITVSFDNTKCVTGCSDIAPNKGSSIQWIADRTVSSFAISNINPAAAFSSPPTQANGWTGVLNPSWLGVATYDISVVPTNQGNCLSSTERKTPKISVLTPMPVKNA